MAHVGEDRWREVFLLTASMLDDATEFCRRYLAAVANLAAQDETVTAMLQWAAGKNTHESSGVKPPAVRAFALYLALDHDHTLYWVRALERGRASAPDFGIALFLPLDRTFDRALTDALAHAHTLDHALGHAYHFDRALNRAHAHALALDLAVTFDLALLDGLSNMSLADLLRRLRVWSWRFSLTDLAALTIPPDGAPPQTLRAFNKQLEDILLAHWQLEQMWQLSTAQVGLLANYLAANRLLVECLAVAYVPGRAEIESQLLLPPENMKHDV
jgi:hypothetical protein